jgi:acetoacetate decarboxylase
MQLAEVRRKAFATPSNDRPHPALGSVLAFPATMGFKHRKIDPAPLLKALALPNFMIKIIQHVDCTG